MYWAAGLAAKGRCGAPLERLWDDWAAMLAAALLAAMHRAQLLQPPRAYAGTPDSTDPGTGSTKGGMAVEGSRQQQQQQQQPWERQRMGQAAFDMAMAARVLLRPAATTSLGTLQRESVPRLLNSLGRQCCIDSTSLRHHVQVLGILDSLSAQLLAHSHSACLGLVRCALDMPGSAPACEEPAWLHPGTP